MRKKIFSLLLALSTALTAISTISLPIYANSNLPMSEIETLADQNNDYQNILNGDFSEYAGMYKYPDGNSVELLSNGLRDIDISTNEVEFRVEDITKSSGEEYAWIPNGAYTWDIVCYDNGEPVDGVTCILYPKGVEVVNYNGKTIPTDTYKVRYWAGNDLPAFEEFIAYKQDITSEKEIKVILNGEEIEFAQPPIIRDDRILVPLRTIFEAMGATVAWNGNTQTVTSTKGSTTVSMTIDSYIMLKNGVEIYLDVPAQLVGDYTMVPVRAVAEAFGADVSWEEDTRTVYIDINTKTHGIVIYADSKYNEIAAQLFTEVLRNNQLGTDEQDVHCLYEPSEDTYNQILSRVRQNAKDEDITYFFYAGHGDDDGNIFPDYNKDSNVDTYMKTPTQLIADLQDIPGTIIVILESCHSGCIQNVENLDRNKFKIITSSTENQYSDTDHLGILGYVKDKRLGTFSEALLDGLGGLEGTNIIYNTITGRDGTVKADYNNDRNVTISELFTYINDNMDHKYLYQFKLFNQDPTCSNANDDTVIYSY